MGDDGGEKPRLEISAEPEQGADTVTVRFRLNAPSEQRICFYNGPPQLVVEWQHQPDICIDPQSREPLVYYYLAELAPPIGVTMGGYVTPSVHCIEKGSYFDGEFEIGPTITRVVQTPSGEGAATEIKLPPQLKLQMVVGYNTHPPTIPTQSLKPLQEFLAWQHAALSNILQVKRKTRWAVLP
jgi:hypothetical protein